MNSSTQGEAVKPHHRRLAFGDFEMDLERGSLSCRGVVIPLRPKSFAMLQYLLEHAGQLVSREELLEAVWPGAVVTDDSVAQCLLEIRKALADDQRSIVRTVPRRGLIFDVPVTVEDPAAPPVSQQTPHAARYRWVPGLAIAAVATLLLWWLNPWKPPADPNDETAAVATGKSIAVLRFTDMSAEGDHAYFGDGLSEEIMHRLAQSPSLRVIARASSFAVDGQSIAAIAEQLNVTHVLEGSVRKESEKIRITAQLIDSATSSHIWSKSYDRSLDDILDVQREIVGAVAETLEVSLADKGPLGDVDPRAYALYLEGRYFYLRRADGDAERAQARYEEALSISPDFAQAWTGLSAVAHVRLRNPNAPDLSQAERERLMDTHRHATEQAIRFGPDLPEAHIRASYYYFLQGERDLAREHVEIARSIDPDHWLVQTVLGNELRRSGLIEESIRVFRREMLQDPLNLVLRENIVIFLMYAGRFEDAQAEMERTFELNYSMSHLPGTFSFHVPRLLILTGDFEAAEGFVEAVPGEMERWQMLALVHHGLGRQADSEAALEQITSAPQSVLNSIYAAEVLAFRGDKEEAMARLGKIEFSTDCSDGFLTETAYYSPFLRKLEGMPEWEDFKDGALDVMKGCLLGLDIPG